MFNRQELEVIFNSLSQLKITHDDKGLEVGRILNSICKKCQKFLQDENEVLECEKNS